MRILALDYGRVHTGVAVSDASGTITRPLADIDAAAEKDGLERIRELALDQGAAHVIVGMPVSLSGRRGLQARETEAFVRALRETLDVPVSTWDERFTSKMAADKGRESSSSSHGLAACCLLESFLASRQYRRLEEEAADGGGNGGGGVEGP